MSENISNEEQLQRAKNFVDQLSVDDIGDIFLKEMSSGTWHKYYTVHVNMVHALLRKTPVYESDLGISRFFSQPSTKYMFWVKFIEDKLPKYLSKLIIEHCYELATSDTGKDICLRSSLSTEEYEAERERYRNRMIGNMGNVFSYNPEYQNLWNKAIADFPYAMIVVINEMVCNGDGG